MVEEDLKPMFIPFGNVVDLHVIRDHASKAHKGCAFVTFGTREETEACIYGLHNKMTLPGMSKPIQVHYAGENPRAGGFAASGNAAGGNTPGTTHKLFIGMVPKTFVEDDLRPIFSPFGEIKDMNVLRGPDGQSKGCAFILFKDVGSAVQAITTLNGKIKLEGATSNLVVQFASSSDKNRSQQLAQQASTATMLGAGFPMMPQTQQFLDPYAGLTSAATTAALGGGAFAAYPQYMLPPTSYGIAPPAVPATSNGGIGSNKEGPPGANLFIYHLPKDYTDSSLMALFSQFGPLVSCKVITDSATGQNKGFGFVSYESPESAQIAILNTNGMQLPGGKRLKVDLKNRAGGAAAGRPY
jgi:CUG-BP- and ETR3-like factor